MVSFLVAWALAAGVYLLFAGQAGPVELAAAAAAGLVATLLRGALRRHAEVGLTVRWRAWPALARALAGLPVASARAAAALVRGVGIGRGGRIAAQAFDTGRQNDDAEVGRRAVAILLASLAPDSFVVRVDEEAHRLRTHALVPQRPTLARWGR
jgi:hypothetical protein